MDFSFYVEKIIHAHHGDFWDCDHLINLSVDKNPQEKAEGKQNEMKKSEVELLQTTSGLKGLVHPKMKILAVFTHPHVVPTP